MEKKRLNADIAGAISDFEEAVREFKLREKIYRIIYRGKGLEFEDFQDYSPDDDASNIDWKASARAGKPVVKRYKEERELEIMFVIDVSENMILGSKEKLKCEYCAELVAAMSHLINSVNDKVGYIFFSDKVKEFVEPKRGRNHFQLLVDKLLNPDTYGGFSNFKTVFDFVLENVDKSVQAVIFISDFVKMHKDFSEELYLIAHKFETTAMMIKDPLDRTLPDINKEILLEDPLTGQQILVNPKTAGKIYEKYALEQENFVREKFRKAGIDLARLNTDENFVIPLAMFMTRRAETKGVIT